MNAYFLLAAVVLFLHLAFILLVIFGAILTRNRPLLGWLHIASLFYGILIEIFDWTCSLTPMENWLRVRAGVPAYQDGFCSITWRARLPRPGPVAADGLRRCRMPVQFWRLRSALQTPSHFGTLAVSAFHSAGNSAT